MRVEPKASDRVVVTRQLPGEAIHRLKERHEVWLPEPDRAIPYPKLRALAREADAMITMLSDRIDRELIAGASRLRVIANYAVGYNNIDLVAAARRGVVVTHTPGVLTNAVAELTWALILALIRRLPEGERLVRAGRWKGWAPSLLLGRELAGRTLAILGMGRIGRAVAARARAFNMRVIAHTRHPLPGPEAEEVEFLPLDRFWPRAEILSIHLPMTPETRHLVSARELAALPPGALLVNTARGEIVDEKALAAAIRSGRLGGVGLDVYEGEPQVRPALLRLPRTILLPHIGSATVEARTKMAEMVVDNVLAVLAGRPAPNPVPLPHTSQ